MRTETIRQAEYKLDSIYENIKQTKLSHADIDLALESNIKSIEDILEFDVLSEEERYFFEEQRDNVNRMRVKESLDYEEFIYDLNKQKDSFEEKIEELKKYEEDSNEMTNDKENTIEE